MLNETKPLRQLVILSGKGGTGKTSVAAGLMHLSALSTNPGVFADADVDAANLALVTEAVPLESHVYWGSQSAEINAELFDRCNQFAGIFCSWKQFCMKKMTVGCTRVKPFAILLF
jgi:MinD superfamily P-loop ATPase